MKIWIEGNGSFGTFLKDMFSQHGSPFVIDPTASTVILAVPISAYRQVALGVVRNLGRTHLLVNVCSVQKPSGDILDKITLNVTGIHPLFGARTPPDRRHAIVTRRCHAVQEDEFLEKFGRFCSLVSEMTPKDHDKVMAKTHLAAVRAAQLLRPFIKDAEDVPNHLVPNSFRLMRDFVKTLDDMPKGTLESIMANEES